MESITEMAYIWQRSSNSKRPTIVSKVADRDRVGKGKQGRNSKTKEGRKALASLCSNQYPFNNG